MAGATYFKNSWQKKRTHNLVVSTLQLACEGDLLGQLEPAELGGALRVEGISTGFEMILDHRVLALLVLALLSIAAGHDGLYQDVARGAPAEKRPQRKYAVLVDAENSSWRKMEPILEEIAKFGDTTVRSRQRRVYGDFTMPELKAWRDVSLDLSFKPVSTMANIPGKGSSDASLIIEAMDLLHTNPSLDGFALVSSDSDFTSLAQRLREAGKDVLGFGQKRNTLKPFVISCAKFIYTENLAGGIHTESLTGGIDTDTPTCAAPAIGGQTHPSARRLSKNAIQLLTTRAVQQASDEWGDNEVHGGWVNLGSIKPILTQFQPDFDLRSYGFRTMRAMVSSEPNHFEWKVVPGGCNYIRLVGGSSEVGESGATGGESAAATIEGVGSAGQLSTDDIKLLTRALQQATLEYGDEGGWVDLGQIKIPLMKFKPEFDMRSYGFPSMKAMMLSEPRLFEGAARCWSDTGVSRGYWIRLVGGTSDATAE